MRVLVAGAAGFIGSHVSEELISLGHEVVGVDNYFTGSKANVFNLLDNPNFELIRHDITFPLYVEVDAIINLASPASPVHYKKDPVQTLKTNVLGSVNLLGIAKRLKIPILQCSTSEVYGDPHEHPQTETYWGNVNPIGPRACYDEGKRAAETLFMDYHRQYGTQVKVARIFNTYGPRMAADDGRVVSEFVTRALLGDDLIIYGNGSQSRSFCYVSDTVDGLLSFLFSKPSLIGPINIGNPEELTVSDLARLVIDKVGGKSRVIFEAPSEDDPKQRRPDISRARDLLDWQPKIKLDAGLDETIAYFRMSLQRLHPDD